MSTQTDKMNWCERIEAEVGEPCKGMDHEDRLNDYSRGVRQLRHALHCLDSYSLPLEGWCSPPKSHHDYQAFREAYWRMRCAIDFLRRC